MCRRWKACEKKGVRFASEKEVVNTWPDKRVIQTADQLKAARQQLWRRLKEDRSSSSSSSSAPDAATFRRIFMAPEMRKLLGTNKHLSKTELSERCEEAARLKIIPAAFT